MTRRKQLTINFYTISAIIGFVRRYLSELRQRRGFRYRPDYGYVAGCSAHLGWGKRTSNADYALRSILSVAGDDWGHYSFLHFFHFALHVCINICFGALSDSWWGLALQYALTKAAEIDKQKKTHRRVKERTWPERSLWSCHRLRKCRKGGTLCVHFPFRLWNLRSGL